MRKIVADITPHPKILTVLGEIEFKPWQCIAELIDNCVDGFLSMERAGTPIADPIVQVAFGRDTVVVKDNGPGMSIDALEMAVKAGWSTHDRFGNLGLYGIGFNIATARLGGLTTIWTTQAGDDEWYGLELDLQKLARGETFKLEFQSEPKSDPKSSGTKVEVSKIKADWKDSFTNAGWIRSNITDRLASIYSTMLRDTNPQPIKFTLYVNNRKVPAWEHCVWPADRERYRKNEGLVQPIQEIDEQFGTKYYSRSTGEFYDTKEGLDEDDIVEVTERVYGWLGIQRYADDKEYGIDILRNGRKIEVGCKDIFDWEDPDGNVIHEYPIDDPRNRGRIVGEIHLDHGYVHYTKHRFEREHSSWKQLLLAVRNNEPLTNRERYKFEGVNDSPLGILFRAFRRNSPLSSGRQTYDDILFIKDNELAKRWAREYRRGVAEYRDDNKWLEELKKSDPIKNDSSGQPANTSTENQGTTSVASSQNGGFILELGEQEESADSQSTTSSGTSTAGDGEVSITAIPASEDLNNGHATSTVINTRPVEEEKISRTQIPDLNLHITGIGISGKAYDIEVYAVTPSSNSTTKPAWIGRLTERNVYEIEVNPQHPAFNSTSLQIRDAVLAQVAYLITFEETAIAGPRNEVNYGDILVSLRNRYALTDSLEVNHLRMDIDELRKRITKRLASALTDTAQRELLLKLPFEVIQRIELAYARGPKNMSILTYFEIKQLAYLLQKEPSVFFESGCFNQAWTPDVLANNIMLLEEHRNRLTQEIWIPMFEMGEFMSELTAPSEVTKSYLAFIRACVNRTKDYMADETRYV